jgi:hypothetical protein
MVEKMRQLGRYPWYMKLWVDIPSLVHDAATRAMKQAIKASFKNVRLMIGLVVSRWRGEASPLMWLHEERRGNF